MEGAGSRKGALTEEYLAFLKRMGEPFGIVTTFTASATTQYFDLDSTDYDWNGDGTDDTDPFKDLALIVTGLRVVVAIASATLSDFIVDEKSILPPDIAAHASNLNNLDFSWRGFPRVATVAAATTEINLPNEPRLADIYGGPLIIRRRFGARSVLLSSGTGQTHAVQLYGFAVPRRLI
jgi:hypothetical protein